MKTTRREFVKAGVAGAAGVVAPAPSSGHAAPEQDKGHMDTKKRRPNVLVIMTDQHSKHFLGCYGNKLVRTPHLDRLAAGGMRLTNAYCPAPLCVPSRMSFMTSRTPSHNRVWNNNAILNSGIQTWAHVLGTAGYETSLIGRMHFCGADQRHGFENRPIGEYGAKHPGAPYRSKTPTRGPYYHGGSGQSRPDVTRAGRGRTTYQNMDERITAKACSYLREHAGPTERPFAAVVGFVLPHCPFIAPKPLFDHYYEKVDAPVVAKNLPSTIERFRRLRKIDRPLTDKQIRVARAAYYGLCEHVDALIGQILTCLDQTGLSDNTLVVYCTDHGEMAGEHGCWWKSNYYEGSAGTPLIARLPGAIAPGSVSKAVCNLIDLGPTFADTAGAGKIPRADGRSLWPTLQGRHPKDWADETFSELCDGRGGNLPSRMIRSGKWKLWYHDDPERLSPALFDLDADPDECHDLGQDPKHVEIREQLLGKLFADWDPELVHEQTAEASKDFAALARWGRQIRPPSPDAMEVPPPEFEADVEML